MVAPPEQLGIPEEERVNVKLVDEDGNIFSILGRVRRAMRLVGQQEKFTEMHQRVMECAGYDAALGIIQEYVNPI